MPHHPRSASRFPSRIGSVALAALLTCALGGALTGCTEAGPAADTPSPAPTGGTQGVAEACEVVTDNVQEATARLQAIDAVDPQASVDAMSQVAASLGEAAAAVDNADVAAVLPELQAGFATTADVLQAIAGGDLSKLPALQQAAAGIQASLEDFADLCGTS